MTALSSIDTLHLAFYVAFVTGNFTASFLVPLAGLPVFIAILYGVCPHELTEHPLVLDAFLPIAVALGGVVGASIALAMRLPPYLYRMGVPSVLQVQTTSEGEPIEFIWRTRLPMLVFGFGLMWLARALIGFVRGCTAHSTLVALGCLAIGVLLCIAGLGAAVYLARDSEQRLGESLDAVYLVSYALVASPALLYFLFQSHSIAAALLLVGFFLLAVVACVALEMRALTRKSSDVRLMGRWRTIGGALKRWGVGLFVPLTLAWVAAWCAERLSSGGSVQYRGLIVLAVLGAVSLILGGLYAAFFCITPLREEQQRADARPPMVQGASITPAATTASGGFNYAVDR